MPPSIPLHSVYEQHCTYLPAMAGWFLFSSLLSIYNKKVFGKDERAFPCPLLMTTVHFLMQWIFSVVACRCFKSLGGERVTTMTWKEWALISIPCGMVTSGDVGFSNLAMVSISLTIYTMAKASTPVFVLGWAYALGIEKITWPLIGVVIVIVAGELLTISENDESDESHKEFQWAGFLLCITASMLSGARWTLVQLKLQTMEPPIKTTIATMRLLAPSMFWSLLMLSIIIERPWTQLANRSGEFIMSSLALGGLGAFLAIVMILCEFYLIMHASAIILMIGGVLKEIFTIFLGVLIFGDRITPRRIVACLIIFGGVLMYKLVFHLEKKQEGAGRYEQVEASESGEEIADPYESSTESAGPRINRLEKSKVELRRSKRQNSSDSYEEILREERDVDSNDV
ncbi:solute carrier family 35, member C2 [Fistulifera solaris]|uniref:Solute carrier family 35, member C2 n=1 Tax=Fistulifera solaris TaxID=1519565 RepID=A0A1Z5JPC8_FISSO|nr:solute carrier family 35, member C2 [Fistulifera solaris]|eukprot:GAX15819.1 solute carrier family 35, member C2 [Fistulifera solaris]